MTACSCDCNAWQRQQNIRSEQGAVLRHRFSAPRPLPNQRHIGMTPGIASPLTHHNGPFATRLSFMQTNG